MTLARTAKRGAAKVGAADSFRVVPCTLFSKSCFLVHTSRFVIVASFSLYYKNL